MNDNIALLDDFLHFIALLILGAIVAVLMAVVLVCFLWLPFLIDLAIWIYPPLGEWRPGNDTPSYMVVIPIPFTGEPWPEKEEEPEEVIEGPEVLVLRPSKGFSNRVYVPLRPTGSKKITGESDKETSFVWNSEEIKNKPP